MADASPKDHPDEQDASMDTILASIRRIIMEDEAVAQPAAAAHPTAAHEDDDDLLVLQPSMIVDADVRRDATMAEPVSGFPSSATQSAADLAAALFDAPPPVTKPVPALEPVAAPPSVVVVPPPPAPPRPEVQAVAIEPAVQDPEALMAPAASFAAAQALASLQNAVRPEPQAAGSLRLLRSGGPTIEDMVRDELRVQLKDWLDSNLPSLVERLVAQEIGRLVGRG